MAAERAGAVVVVDWDETRAVLSGGGLLALSGEKGVMAERAAAVSVMRLGLRARVETRGARAKTAPDTLRQLNQLVFRTFVPASDQSRRDAGAGGNDNL
jgi:hypothetical protein